MRVLINHLTRMHGAHICVAGVDVETRRHVRPMLGEGNMPFYLLARYGGPFDLARIIDLGSARATPEPPHVEDHVFVPARARCERSVTAAEFWGLLAEVSSASLGEIFGDALRPLGRARYGTDEGKGSASLGCLCPQGTPELYLTTGPDRKPRIRIRFCDGRIEVDAGVTDLRLYRSDHATPEAAVVQAVTRWIGESAGVILGVGLTRKYRPAETQPFAHWLQVNNIHLKEDPTWQLR